MSRLGRRGLLHALWIAAAVAMLAFCALRLELRTDVTSFLPDSESAELAGLSRRMTDSRLARTMVLTVGPGAPEATLPAAEALAERLRGLPAVDTVRTGAGAEAMEPLFELYYPRRHYLISPRPEAEIPELASEAALRERAQALRRELAGPAGPLLERVAPGDPLGAFRRITERLRTLRPEMAMHEGRFVSKEGRYAVVLLETAASPFDADRQAPFLRELDAAWEAVRAEHGASLELDASGMNRFAVRIEEAMRSDVVLVMAVSILGVAGLFLALFGSPARFGLAVLPALMGILAATTLGLLVLGRVDGLTLAFGACLIGVAIDYSIHWMNHAGLGEHPARTRRLRGSIALGAGTTMASFAGLALTAFPGFREIGLFSIAGIAVALAFTLLVLPRLLPPASPGGALPARALALGDALARAVAALGRRRRALAAVPVLALAFAAATLPQLRWQDDLSALSPLDPELVREEGRVRERVARFDAGRFVVAFAEDEAAAVERADAVRRALEPALEEGALGGVRSLRALLLPEALQRENRRVLAAQERLAERVERIFTAEGFRPGAFAPFRRALEQGPQAPPLALEDLRASPLAGALDSMLLPVGERVATVTHLREVQDVGAVRAALSGLEEVSLFEQDRFLDELYRGFRETTLQQIAVGTLLVALVLLLRYRRVRPALAAFLPSVLTALVLLGVLSAFGVRANLLHAVTLILVMGMGVDYGVFLVDSAEDPEGFRATLLSLVASCGTTVFVFGALALSEHPALRAMGVTAGAGILLAFLLAPVTLVALGPRRGGDA